MIASNPLTTFIFFALLQSVLGGTPTHTKLLLQGDAAPWGGTFSSLSTPLAITSTGAAVYYGVTIGKAFHVLATPGAIQPLFSKDNAVPGPGGRVFDSIYSSNIINRRGDVVFFADTRVPGQDETEGLFLYSTNGKLFRLAQIGDQESGGSIFESFPYGYSPAISSRGGYVAFTANVFSGTEQAIYRAIVTPDTLNVQRVVEVDGDAPDGGKWKKFHDPSLNQSLAVNDFGNMIFYATTTMDSSGGLYYWDGSNVAKVPGTVFVRKAMLNNAGQIAALTPNGYGIDDIITFGTAQATQVIVRKRSAAPRGGTFHRASDPILNEAGQVAFQAETFHEVGIFYRSGIFLWSQENGLQMVANEQEAAPGGSSFGTFSDANIPRLTDNGRVFFYNVRADKSPGIFMGDGESVDKVISKGDMLEGELVADVNLGLRSYYDDSQHVANYGPSNARAQLVYWASLYTSERNGIFLYDPKLPEPDINVELPGAPALPSGANLAFGSVVAGTSKTITLKIKNTGEKDLTVQGLNLEDSDDQFGFVELASVVIPADGSTDLMVQFSPTTTGSKTATLQIISNDPDETLYDIVIEGKGADVPPATVKSLAATSVTFDSATLNGTVNAKGFDREVFFDWGSTKSLGISVAAQPSVVVGSVNTSVAAVLTGLLPHTTYHFRARAKSLSGPSVGSVVAFTTLNRAPVAAVDNYTIVPGSTVTLPVLSNDSDADGDAMSLSTHTAITPPSAGKLTKVGNTFVFAAASSFTTASFSYTCKDAFKGTSVSATVTLTAGTASLIPPTITQPSAGVSYPVTVTATGMWSVSETLPWVAVSPAAEEGDGTAMVTLLPNTAKAERKGIVMIGGKPHSITQQGVVQPTLAMPIMAPEPEVVDGFTLMPPAVVGGLYSFTLPTTGFPVSYKVTKLPPGLTIDGNTGVMSGRPTAGGTYDLTLQANNAAGASAVLKLRIVVAALHPGLVGTFHGFIDRQSSLNAGLGSRFELTTTTMGSFSGKWITGTTSVPFAKGQLNVDSADANHPTATIVIPRSRSTPLTLELDFSAQDDALTGNLSDVDANITTLQAWRNPWSRTNPAPAYYKVRHSFLLEQGDTTASLPQGYGFGSFDPVNSTTGAVTIKGLLADGSIYATTSFLSRKGELLIYQPLYGRRGSVLGKIVLMPHDAPTADHAITGMLNWWKPSPLPNSIEVIYRSGFGPLSLIAEGADCPPVTAGGLILGLPGNSGQAVIQFSEGGLPGSPPTFSHSITLNNPSPRGLTNKATLNANAPSGLKMTALDAAKGGFNGEFTMPTGRKALFNGQLVKRAGVWSGYGYFLLAEVPEGNETVTTSPRNSGKVELSPQ